MLAALLTGSAAANDGLLGPGGYPRMDCGARPAPPERPAEFRTEAALAAYNAAVQRYNDSMERWIGCVQDYVDGAAADIERIKARMREAVAEANREP